MTLREVCGAGERAIMETISHESVGRARRVGPEGGPRMNDERMSKLEVRMICKSLSLSLSACLGMRSCRHVSGCSFHRGLIVSEPLERCEAHPAVD